MNEELHNLIDEAKTIANETRSSFGFLTAAQLNWQPAPDRWSIAQCFDHLITAHNGYLPIIDGILSGTKKSTFWERLPLLPRLSGKLLIKSLDPASTRKLKAPKNFQPAQSNIRETIIDDFVAQQSALVERMKATAHLDPEHIIITSPVASMIAYSLMDAYRIIVVHEKRHFQQAQRVAAEQAIPSPSDS